jgi:hypothetical protein
VDDVIEGERVQGYGNLVTAKEKVDACAELAAQALEDVSVSGAAD